MGTALIELQDGLLVEVEVELGEMKPVSSRLAEKVQASFAEIRGVLVEVGKSLAKTWEELNQEMFIKEAEIEIGLAFESEGNIYITKTKASANFMVKLTLMPEKTHRGAQT